jgi:glyoxylase-like metal-dependent hydrolase (beta-lactamase superfamily II)
MNYKPDLVEIFGTYTAWKAYKNTWIISFMNGSEYMYLLEGSHKSLLIDTGFGAGNLKHFVSSLTDKEIIVVNTHFHPDHAGGNGEFEKVYMSKYFYLDKFSIEENTPFDLTKLPYPNYKKILIEEKYIFDLGNRKVEVIDVKPAHCNSSIFLFDYQEKLIFTGDELESAQVNIFDNSNNPNINYNVLERLEHMRENLNRILNMSNNIRAILPNHNGTPIDVSYLQDYLGLIDHIYIGDAIIEDKLNHKYIEMDPKASKLCRIRYKRASIFIEKAEVLKVYGNI